MAILIFVLFSVAALIVLLWAGLSSREHIAKPIYQEGLLARPRAKPKRVSSSMAIDEAMRLYKEGKTISGVGVAEQALCSVLLFQVGSPSRDATLDATILGLITLKKLDGKSGEIQEILENFGKVGPDFLRNHLDSDVGGAKFHSRAYPTMYATYYFIQGVKFCLSVNLEEPLTYQKLAYFIGKMKARKLVDFIEHCEYEIDEDTEAFSETPGGPIGTITTGGAAQILLDIGLDERPSVPYFEGLGNKAQKAARFVTMCKLSLSRNGLGPVGFVNELGSQKAQTISTRHALKAYDLIGKIIKSTGGTWKTPELSAESIRGFYTLCKKNHGFSRVPEEPASIYYTDQVLCSTNYYPFKDNLQEIRALIVTYKGMLDFIESCLWQGGWGFEPKSYPNIYATRAALHTLINLKKIFTEDKLQQYQAREKGLTEQARRAILAHFDLRTGLAVGYRPIRM